MFGIGKLRKRVDSVEAQIRETHIATRRCRRKFGIVDENGIKALSADEAIEYLIYKANKDSCELHIELDAIHAAWTKQQCEPCAHNPVCEKSLKYGEECENRMILEQEVKPDAE